MKPTRLRSAAVVVLLIGLTSVLPAQTINVAAGQDGITNALATAPNGATIVLTTSGGEYVESATLNPTTKVTIKAATGLAVKPAIYTLATDIILVSKASLTLQGITLSGNFHGNPLGGNGIQIKMDSLPGGHFYLLVDNCEFTGFADATNGRCIVSSDGSKTVMDSVIIQNSYFHDMLKQGIYLKNTRGSNIKPGVCYYGKVENCLFVRSSSSGDGHATYLEPWDKTQNASYPIYLVNHVTAYRMAVGGPYIYGASEGVIQNSITNNSCQLSAGGYMFRAEPGRFAGAKNSKTQNCIWFNPAGLATGGVFVTSSSQVAPTQCDTVKVWNVDPQFADTLLAFALKPTSPGKKAGTDGRDLGYLAGGLATAVESPTEQMIPETFQLSQNYPNPFNPATTIQFSIAKAGRYSVNVFNVLGQKVAGLFDRAVAPGNYSVQFDAAHLPSGMYIYTLTGDGVNVSKKMALLK